ncbi:hypothetical protein [Streptomyces sp. NBC_00878]|uniref:hypothetical protein n=1 Tax=Streptomyces sp. NBC_00878 TaxID=2975854 RepID=UPI002B1D45CB|nr:hypothetical protein [Streptomyces sp. NBC_00878]
MDPVTERVVGAADVVFEAAGALVVLVGAAAAGRDADGLGEEAARFVGVFVGEAAEADGEDGEDGEGGVEASAVISAVGSEPFVSAGSVVGLSESSSTMPETVAAVASTAWRIGCFFFTRLTAHGSAWVSQAPGVPDGVAHRSKQQLDLLDGLAERGLTPPVVADSNTATTSPSARESVCRVLQVGSHFTTASPHAAVCA